MDCLEFRRRLAAEPRSREPAFLAHRDGCHAGCTEAWWRAQKLERRIDQALAIDAPEGLAERILLAQATDQRRRVRRRWQTGFALAASLVLALGIGFVALRPAQADPLPLAAVTHVHGKEAFALQLTAPIPDSALREGFAAHGLTLRAMPQGAVYVHDCDFGPYRTVHVTFRENNLPVSALYFMDRAVAKARDVRVSGELVREVPMDHGTLVMVGEDAQSFTRVERSLRDALQGAAQQAVGEY